MASNSQSPYNIIKVEDVKASRALGALYTNNTGRTLFVLIEVQVTSLNAGADSRVIGRMSFTPGGAVVTVGAFGFYNTQVSALQMQGMVIMIVPPGCDYDTLVISTGGATTLEKWTEAY